MMIFVMISSKYITIRQRNALNQIRKINFQLSKSASSQPGQRLLWNWIRFVRINKDVLHVCSQTRAYSACWAHFLTITWPYYVFEPCYLFYCAVTSTAVPDQAIFSFAVTAMIASFYWLIRHCALVVQYNSRICTAN